MPTRAPDLFQLCAAAVVRGEPVQKRSPDDKEYGLQDWVARRLNELGAAYRQNGRNKFPDFPLDDGSEGFEVKGLMSVQKNGKPGRLKTYDSNSQVPAGKHEGRAIYYVFARYPWTATLDCPVDDMVICHGDFLNPSSDYVHKNKSLKTFGGYGDIMIRDRKMYVVRTPYSLADGLIGQRTLIMPSGEAAPDELVEVGTLTRREANDIVVGYHFDLRTNELEPETEPNPSAGREHAFTAYRMPGDDEPGVAISDEASKSVADLAAEETADDEDE